MIFFYVSSSRLISPSKGLTDEVVWAATVNPGLPLNKILWRQTSVVTEFVPTDKYQELFFHRGRGESPLCSQKRSMEREHSHRHWVSARRRDVCKILVELHIRL